MRLYLKIHSAMPKSKPEVLELLVFPFTDLFTAIQKFAYAI